MNRPNEAALKVLRDALVPLENITEQSLYTGNGRKELGDRIRFGARVSGWFAQPGNEWPNIIPTPSSPATWVRMLRDAKARRLPQSKAAFMQWIQQASPEPWEVADPVLAKQLREGTAPVAEPKKEAGPEPVSAGEGI